MNNCPCVFLCSGETDCGFWININEAFVGQRCFLFRDMCSLLLLLLLSASSLRVDVSRTVAVGHIIGSEALMSAQCLLLCVQWSLCRAFRAVRPEHVERSCMSGRKEAAQRYWLFSFLVLELDMFLFNARNVTFPFLCNISGLRLQTGSPIPLALQDWDVFLFYCCNEKSQMKVNGDYLARSRVMICASSTLFLIQSKLLFDRWININSLFQT